MNYTITSKNIMNIEITRIFIVDKKKSDTK